MYRTASMIAGKSIESLFLKIQACLVFTDASSKTVNIFLDRNAVQGLAGIGIQGQTDGSKAEL